MSRPKSKQLEIVADVRYENGNWVAHPTSPEGQRLADLVDANGERIIGQARSPTRALSRLQLALENAGHSATVSPKWNVPTPHLARYNKFAKDLAKWLELTESVVPERVDLAQIFTDEYNMPLNVVAELVGLSPPRLGVLLDKLAAGKPLASKRGRPKRDDEEDDQ